MTEMMEKPQPPADFECCESGCTLCVWDLYYEALQVWKDQQAQINSDEHEKQADE